MAQYDLVFSLQAEAQKFVAASGAAVASGKRVADMQAELASRGVMTTRAFMDELRAIERLSKEAQHDQLVTAQLAQQKARLLREIRDLEQATQMLTSAEIKLNAAGRLTNATTGRFVAGAQAQIALRQELNALGIRTTEQMEEELQMLMMLETAYANDAAVMTQLSMRRQQLQRSSQSLISGNRQLEHSLYSLGFIINDSAQFSYGFGAGLRSIANNIQPLIFQLSAAQLSMAGLKSALMGPAGLILAFNAVTTAAVLFGDKIKSVFSSAKKEAKSMSEEVQGALSSMLDIDVPMRKAVVRSREAMRSLLQELRREAEEVSTTATVLVPGPFGILQSRTVSTGEFAKATKEQLEEGAAWLEKQLFMMGIQDRLWEKIGGHVEEVTDKKKESAAAQQEINSLIDDELSRQRELREHLTEMADGGARRLTGLQAANAALEKQLALTLAIARAQNAPGRVTPRGMITSGAEAAAYMEGDRGLIPSADDLRMTQLDEATQKFVDRQIEQQRRWEESWRSVSDTIRGSVGEIVAGYSAAIPQLIAGTANLTQVSAQLIGDFTQQLGKTLIGYGTAGIAIKAFINNPIAAIAAGAGLVALGAALKQTAKAQVSSFTGGGSAARGGTYGNLLYHTSGLASDGTIPGSAFSSPSTTHRSSELQLERVVKAVERVERAIENPRSMSARFEHDAGRGIYVAMEEEAAVNARRLP